jgi:hypothetical protein
MSARFRIRTPQGQELSFGSEEMFADFVRSGELSADDLVYDATTGEWSPALTHSFVLELQPRDRAGDAGETQAGSSEHDAAPSDRRAAEGPAEVGDAGPGPDDTSGLGFQLAPEQTPEEAAAAFLKEMEAERESAFERREEMRGLKSDESGAGLLRDLERTPPGPPIGDPPRGKRGFAGDAPAPEPSPTPAGPPGRTSKKAGTRSKKARSGREPRFSGAFLFWALVFGAVGVGVLLGPDLVALAMNTDSSDPGAEVGVPILPDTEEALRGRADARFLSRAMSSLSELPVVPREWLDGRYLAHASEYPGVRSAWSAYLDAVRRLRVDESEYYSTAYLSALDDARVTGATRTLRLASALSRFERDRPIRAAHYDRVTELTTAAIALHDLLVEREASITYEPAVGTRVSSDPVLQAAAADPETRRLLEAALDRVLAALSARGLGPVEAAGVGTWMFEGLRDVVAPE